MLIPSWTILKYNLKLSKDKLQLKMQEILKLNMLIKIMLLPLNMVFHQQ